MIFKNYFLCFAFFLSLTITTQSHADIAWDATLAARNFHTVEQNKLYRSAQLTKNEISKIIEQYNIKTVINLRGENIGESWYDNEKMVTEKYNVHHVDISMSADTIPHRNNLLKLLDAYQNAPRPILIHCKAGADRTGEAVAIYAMEFMNQTRAEATKHLSLKYRHSKTFKPGKDYFIEKVYNGIKWAHDDYHPCQGGYKYYDVNSQACK